MLLPNSALLNPAANQVDLFAAPFFVRVFRGHAAGHILMRDSLIDQASLWISRRDGNTRGSQLKKGIAQVEPESGHAGFRIRTVTLVIVHVGLAYGEGIAIGLL